jgi:DNA helicase-2/ATP-dependent DNA helicase PcrA
MDLLEGLNIQQQQALSAGVGPVLVLAGPGSGKTRVLTQRIAYLIGKLGVRPYNILAVTFTNKAAREMEGRVEQLLDGGARGLTLGTFHATCARILRREAQYLPFTNNFVIFDADDQLGLVKRAILDLDVDEKKYRPQSVHASISRAKNELILPDDYPLNTYRDEVVRRIYERYQELLMTSNAVDFDDLLLWTAVLLEEQTQVRERYARRYEHVLVDEFQDTNMAQYMLLKHLANFHRNIFVVGDTDQSIYRWRGADYRNVMRFESDYPDAQVILLERNYRSTQNILDVAMAVIDRNKFRTPKKLFTDRGAGDKINLHEAFSGREEAKYVVDTIAIQVAHGMAEPGDFAIMYRTNAQSRLLEEAFLYANLPYKLVGAQRFYGRREVKDVMAFLRLVHNPDDETSLFRMINVPPRRIGNKTLIALRTRCLQANLSPGDLLLDLSRGVESTHYEHFSRAAGLALSNFGKKLWNWREVYTGLSPLGLMDRILGDVNYQEYLDDGTEEGQDRWENVLELRRLAAEYNDRRLTDFLEQVALISDQDTMDATANVPTLLTLHAAKGLEFPVVIITGLEDSTLPHFRSFDDPEAMAEERRLFYVGITRAQDRLYFTYALNRRSFGYSEPTIPSRFLEDIPDDMIDGGNPLRLGMPSLDTRRPDLWETTSHESTTPILQPIFKAGMNVRHPAWGEGVVLTSRIEDRDEILDIFFEGLGLKKVVASLAKLKIVDG